jgi:hypothetical protein
MTTKTKRSTRRSGQETASDLRVTIRFAPDTLEALAAWARADGRTPAAQARFLIEQAVGAREDRLALTRR